MLSVHVSVMSGKLLGIPAINTNTLSNAFCRLMALSNVGKLICAGTGNKPQCYSWRMLTGSRKNCVAKFEQNSKLLSEWIPWDWLPVFNSLYLRFHGHGELINLVHLMNFHRIALKNPQTTFGLWTKRRDLIREYHRTESQPRNLILIYSNPRTDKVLLSPPTGFNKVFNAVDHSHRLENCTGRVCKDCLTCYKHSGESVIVEKVKIRN